MLNLETLTDRRVKFGDTQAITACGDNRTLRNELGLGHGRIRRPQGHTGGSGGRPDCLPSATNMNYLAHGASIEASKVTTREGLSKCQRVHIHFYECDRGDNLLVGNITRSWPDVAIVIASRQCVAEGISLYHPPNNVAISEGIIGVIGHRYFRFVRRLRRNPHRRRCVRLGQSDPAWFGGDQYTADHPKRRLLREMRITPQQRDWATARRRHRPRRFRG